jgi:hypothetical protein
MAWKCRARPGSSVRRNNELFDVLGRQFAFGVKIRQ